MLCILIAACGEPSEEERAEMTTKAEQVAAQARTEIDALAARLGTRPVVKQDTLINCEFGQDDSGKYLSYILHIKVEPGALDRLRTEVAADYAADGWTVAQDPEGTRFLKGRASIGAMVFEDIGLASVFGSGGCSE